MLEQQHRGEPALGPDATLVVVKALHTVVWAFFAGCIVAVPTLAAAGRFRSSLACGIAVAVEVGVLIVNRMRCPLTDLAARYTVSRRANFDIYLPEWLAEHNKVLFGALYVLGSLAALVLWAQSTP